MFIILPYIYYLISSCTGFSIKSRETILVYEQGRTINVYLTMLHVVILLQNIKIINITNNSRFKMKISTYCDTEQ